MILSFRIFRPKKIRGSSTLTLSEKLHHYSIAAIFSLGILSYIFDIYNKPILYLLAISAIGYLASFIVRLNEHENINGYFEGDFQFKDDYMQVDDRQFEYQHITNFTVSAGDFYGKPTPESRSGPCYTNGIGNSIKFTYNDEKIKFFFEINTPYEVRFFFDQITTLICQEKIKYSRHYLNFIPQGHRESTEFINFVAKLIKEKRVDCTEGLLLIGYSSDEEAMEMRAKYCC